MFNLIENNVKCDLYIGENAGKKILNNIDKAKKSIKIISPFLNSRMIDKLLKVKEKGVDIKLISTDNIAGLNDKKINIKMLKKLVEQKTYLDKNEDKRRKKFLKILIFCIFILIVYFSLGYYLLIEDIVDIFAKTIEISAIYVVALIYMVGKYKNWKIYNYNYILNLNAKFAFSPANISAEERKKFTDINFYHTKLYIIDDEIAFLGSLNLTSSGMYYNHESCITIKDKNTIKKMNSFFEDLFKNIRTINLRRIVSSFYTEKRN